MQSKVLVTGATGHLGSALVRALHARGAAHARHPPRPIEDMVREMMEWYGQQGMLD